MPSQIMADRTLVHADEATQITNLPASNSLPRPATDLAVAGDELRLATAVQLVGEHPEEAARLTQELGLSFSDSKQYSDSILQQTLRGAAVPPPSNDEWWDAPPAGAFDSGVARVMGREQISDLYNLSLCPAGTPWQPTKDVLEGVRQEVTASYSFARYASMIVAAFEDTETKDERMDAAEYEISRSTAVGFLAGWYMALEHAETQTGKAVPMRRGVQETF